MECEFPDAKIETHLIDATCTSSLVWKNADSRCSEVRRSSFLKVKRLSSRAW